MRRGLVALVVLLVAFAPAAEAAKPSVAFERKTVTALRLRRAAHVAAAGPRAAVRRRPTS